ncbi:MAG: hypothetical protein JRG97_01615 [Deltaproteobacteria bacterium]|nr:hypothetical protein [Deltaproteobacteria bacterium]MBW2139753.1 hypothetical protein [Deltaproteobacteria bacterium]MBW2323749.1 hypothetical protein [Deltaproteobacteria bacterium]
MKKILETDLYAPIRDYLKSEGYHVQAEVNHCDVIASKGNDLIVVELKRNFSVDLLVQATDRQSITDSVYVALPASPGASRKKHWRKKIRLLRQLELGLIVVNFKSKGPEVAIICHPLPFQRQKLKRKKRAVLSEISNRTGNYNQGGSTRRKIVTAYRENVIHIACCLEKFGPLKSQQLRAMETGPKTLSILSSNFYKWFQRIERGVYDLTELGKSELNDYPDLAEKYRKKLDLKTSQPA